MAVYEWYGASPDATPSSAERSGQVSQAWKTWLAVSDVPPQFRISEAMWRGCVSGVVAELDSRRCLNLPLPAYAFGSFGLCSIEMKRNAMLSLVLCFANRVRSGKSG